MNETKKDYYTSQSEINAMQEELAHAFDLDVTKTNTYARKKIFKIIESVISVLIICVLGKIFLDVTTARANNQVPTVFGYQIYEVQTGSMDPTLPVNSLIVSEQVSKEDLLKTGDVITFVHDEVTITHRIIEVLKENEEIRYRTKGDNAMNSIDPDLIKPEEVKARFIMKLPFYLSWGDDGGEAA